MVYVKKVLIFCICIIVATSCGYAETIYGDAGSIAPYYVTTRSTSEVFIINSTGNASMTATLKPLNNNMIDQVKMTLCIKKIGGNVVYNKTFNGIWSNLFSEYNLTKTYQLPSRGTYTFNVIYKCYRNNTLVETITTDYVMDSY